MDETIFGYSRIMCYSDLLSTTGVFVPFEELDLGRGRRGRVRGEVRGGKETSQFLQLTL